MYFYVYMYVQTMYVPGGVIYFSGGWVFLQGDLLCRFCGPWSLATDCIQI